MDSLNEEGNITIDIIPSKIPEVQYSLKRQGGCIPAQLMASLG